MANFDLFRSEFKGDLITPSDEGYEKAIFRWARTAVRRAAIVAYVKDAEDVVLALKYARDAGLRVAIHSGGHSVAGTSSVDGGLVIDLSRYVNTIRVDPKAQLAYVGGGANWGTFDQETMKYGLAGVAGTVSHTGVGGLSTGGGYGWLSGRHGLVVDNTIQVTIVTADGSILVANDSQNQDLFWGVRGGGSNFGVVTEFVFKIHPQSSKIFAGTAVFTADKREKIAEFLDEWWPKAGEDEGIIVAIARGPDGTPSIICFVFYNGTEADGRAKYKKLFDLGPVADLSKERDYTELTFVTNPLSEPGLNYYFKGVLLSNDKPSSDLSNETFKKVVELTGSKDHIAACILEYIPHKKINSVSPDATPYRRNLPGNILILVQWKGDSPAEAKAGRDIGTGIASLFSADEGYGNYGDGLGTEGAVSDKAKALFREHYPKLQALKKKYDPDMVFNKWYNITPA